MAEQHLISLILPAYNEAARISHTLEQAKEYFETRRYEYEIIVAADGTDGTRELALEVARTEPRVKVMGTSQRRGKGIGIREAVMQAQGTIIGFADADNKTPIEEFDKFIPLLSADWTIVIGSRAEPQSTIEQPQPLYRRWGSKVFAVLMHGIVGLDDIKDTQCGFKFFRRQTALDLFSRQKIDGYMFDVEILYMARRVGYPIAQVPVRWRDDADSRLQLVRGNVRNGIDLLSIPILHHKRVPIAELAKTTSRRAG